MIYKNIAIMGKNPAEHLSEMVECSFHKNFPYADPQANYICCLKDCMTPAEFFKFLDTNHISVVWVSNNFSFDCSTEHYTADEFKAAVEQILPILWECPTPSTRRRKNK